MILNDTMIFGTGARIILGLMFVIVVGEIVMVADSGNLMIQKKQ
jgi:hypothetical protein